MKLCKICNDPTSGYMHLNSTAFCSIECFGKHNNKKVKSYYKTDKGKANQLVYEKSRNTKQCTVNRKEYHKKWSDEDISKLIKLRKDGLTYSQLICKFEGRTIWSIKAMLQRVNKITPKSN